jgi:hypothetical protein
MADSENSRTLPLKTRNLISVVTDFLADDGERSTARDFGDNEIDRADTIARWEDWCRARARHHKLSRRQQRLEKKLFEKAKGFPHVELVIADRPAPVFARSAAEIDQYLHGPELEEARSYAKVKLAGMQAAWDAADAEIGYTAAYAAENKAYGHALDLAEDLWRARSPTIEAVTAKLHCLIEMEEPGIDVAETPWPQLRSILADVLCLYSQLVGEEERALVTP